MKLVQENWLKLSLDFLVKGVPALSVVILSSCVIRLLFLVFSPVLSPSASVAAPSLPHRLVPPPAASHWSSGSCCRCVDELSTSPGSHTPNPHLSYCYCNRVYRDYLILPMYAMCVCGDLGLKVNPTILYALQYTEQRTQQNKALLSLCMWVSFCPFLISSSKNKQKSKHLKCKILLEPFNP